MPEGATPTPRVMQCGRLTDDTGGSWDWCSCGAVFVGWVGKCAGHRCHAVCIRSQRLQKRRHRLHGLRCAPGAPERVSGASGMRQLDASPSHDREGEGSEGWMLTYKPVHGGFERAYHAARGRLARVWRVDQVRGHVGFIAPGRPPVSAGAGESHRAGDTAMVLSGHLSRCSGSVDRQGWPAAAPIASRWSPSRRNGR
jgi:hypothetical protein